MASIYDIDYELQTENLTPPDKRKPKFLAYLYAFVSVVQTIRDRFYNQYADGFVGSFWLPSTPYAKGDKVIGPDNAVYEVITSGFAGSTDPPNLDPINYTKIQDTYIGLRERLKYNSQKLLLEYILNKWFRVAVPPADQIYITNNSLDLNGFVLGEFEDTSSSIAQTESYQQGYLGNLYGFDSYAFTIYVPVAVFNALASTDQERENIIRARADKYVYAGFIYNVIKY